MKDDLLQIVEDLVNRGYCPNCGCDLWNTKGCSVCPLMRRAYDALVVRGLKPPREYAEYMEPDGINLRNMNKFPEPRKAEPRKAVERPVQPKWLYEITSGLADNHKIRVLIDGKKFAVVQCPGGRWGDNSGTHYGSTTYYLVDKECTTYKKSVGLINADVLQDGGRAKLAQWKKLIDERDANGQA